MDCTFWANLRYTVPETNTGYRDGMPIIIVLSIMIFAIVAVNIFCPKFRSVASSVLGTVLLLQSAFVWFCTAGFIQYTATLVFLMIAYCFINRQIIYFAISKQKILFTIFVSLFFISFMIFGAVLYGTILEYPSSDTYSNLCDEIIATEKSVLVMDCDGLTGALMDRGYMPKSRYCLFQTWHVLCGVVNEIDMVNAFEEDGVDEIWFFMDVGKSIPDWLDKDELYIYKKTRSFLVNNDFFEATCYVFEK